MESPQILNCLLYLLHAKFLFLSTAVIMLVNLKLNFLQDESHSRYTLIPVTPSIPCPGPNVLRGRIIKGRVGLGQSSVSPRVYQPPERAYNSHRACRMLVVIVNRICPYDQTIYNRQPVQALWELHLPLRGRYALGVSQTPSVSQSLVVSPNLH